MSDNYPMGYKEPVDFDEHVDGLDKTIDKLVKENDELKALLGKSECPNQSADADIQCKNGKLERKQWISLAENKFRILDCGLCPHCSRVREVLS